MRRITFYSFKGGTGRSLALANVAYLLAKKGAKVGCIDFDIESAGLNFIFDIPPGKMHKYVQDFLIEPEECYRDTSGFSEIVVSVAKEKGWDLKGELYLIPADIDSTKTSNVEFTTTIFPRVKKLCEKFGRFYDLEYILIDSRSGISDYALPPLAMTDLLLVFFRWGRQHKEGTTALATWISDWLKVSNPNSRVQLIVSNIPEDITQENISGYERKGNFKEYDIKIIAAIYENALLKKEELILTNIDPKSKTSKEYGQIAKSIIQFR